MTIKIKSTNQSAPIPASPAQITQLQTDLSVLTPTAATTLIQANSVLGNLAAPVQTVVNTSYGAAVQRINHIGNDPAANVVFTDNVTLQQWRATVEAALIAAGTSAPVNTVQPTGATGTTNVGSTLSASAAGPSGTWTGTGGTTPLLYKWYQQDAVTGIRTPIANATASTYILQQSDYSAGGIKIIQAVAGQAASGVTAAYVFATAPTATIGTTLATNSGTVPAITGSAVAGSTLSLAMGVWTGATNGWSAQWYVAGIASGSPTAISLTTPITFITDNSMIGKAVSAIVFGYNSFNVPSASPGITATGPVTVTGATPSVVNTVVPAWPGTLQLEVQATLTPGTWTGTINSTRVYDFYRNGTAASNLVRAGNTAALYTPHASEGVVVGDTLYFIEKVTETATNTVYQAVSAGKVCAATPVSLAATTAQTGLSWTAGTAISAVIPVTATGGTTPYVFTCSGLPSGLTMASTTGQITGTPASAISLTTYTVNVTDAVSAATSSTFTATVAAASVTALTAAPVPVFAIVTGGGANYDQTASQSVGGVVRIAPVTDAGGSGRTLDLQRVYNAALGNSTEQRCEKYWGDVLVMTPGLPYTLAFTITINEPMSASSQDDGMVIHQTHTPMNGDTQPPVNFADRTQDNTRRILISYQTAAATLVGGVYTTSTQATRTVYSGAIPATGVAVSYIYSIVPGWTSAQNPSFNCWQKVGKNGTWTQIVTNDTGFNDYNNPLFAYTKSYPRLGLYKFSGSQWNNSTISYIYSPLYFQQGSGLFANAQQALSGL